ncbi:precorrin-2 dehydrogenase/sirohydrochlorin ferrochelatase family protein [Zhaonella formicivorans]|uniref:precorrin-2 dehydrogenase/sirohydrochlorin ferrochelatase family protein n=1 Tax=Zhaonella formicivorans TaxID=2528593 RepID=UPI0010D1CE6A|nr:bifunctional precorrin-2 dehydrogenase/sirohydrochlorin ferrochelatase [Zhaonella formicivorans]
MHKPYYPISLNLCNKKCLVVGGGKVAERKVMALLECGGQVVVVSPQLTEKLRDLAGEGLIRHVAREYSNFDLEDAFLVVSATAREDVNKKIAEECFERNILVNVVDDPAKCNFIVPATVRRGDLTISISTGGKSPALAKKIRKELELQYGDEYAQFLEIMGEIRKRVIESISEQEKRQEIFNRLVEEDFLELLKAGQEQLVKERIAQCISL